MEVKFTLPRITSKGVAAALIERVLDDVDVTVWELAVLYAYVSPSNDFFMPTLVSSARRGGAVRIRDVCKTLHDLYLAVTGCFATPFEEALLDAFVDRFAERYTGSKKEIIDFRAEMMARICEGEGSRRALELLRVARKDRMDQEYAVAEHSFEEWADALAHNLTPHEARLYWFDPDPVGTREEAKIAMILRSFPPEDISRHPAHYTKDKTAIIEMNRISAPKRVCKVVFTPKETVFAFCEGQIFSILEDRDDPQAGWWIDYEGEGPRYNEFKAPESL